MPITGQKTTVPFISTPNVSVSNVQNQDLLNWDSTDGAFKNTSLYSLLTVQGTGSGDRALFKENDGSKIVLRDLVGGTNISLALDTNGNIVINQDISSIPIVDGESLGTGSAIFSGKNNNKLSFNSIAAGNNMTLSTNNNTVTIATTSPDDGLNKGTGKQVFFAKSLNKLEFRSLTAGTNINLVENVNDIVISTDNGTGTDQQITSRFELQLNFNASGNFLSASNLPTGWTATTTGTNLVEISHTTGRTPVSFTYFGYDSANTEYRMRIPTGAYYVSYKQATETTKFTLLVNASSAGTFANGHAILKMVF
tara:strand:- start:760 stop:1689 length:930 start_codon:yes stop_codon:yes gene_type:complete